MIKITEIDDKIVKQLIKNPRIADTQISKNIKVPIMTVNRRRRFLEEEGVLNYYTSIKKHQDGIKRFSERQLYIIKLKSGITRKTYIDTIELAPELKIFNSQFISTTLTGEKDGHLALVIILDAKDGKELIEEFNGKIIRILEKKFGSDVIREIITVRINDTIRIHHNYLPFINMKNGIIAEDWPEEFIFSGLENFGDKKQKLSKLKKN